MASHAADLWGEIRAEEHWRDHYQFVILHAPPLRPGRGRSKAQSNRKGLRGEGWNPELACLKLKSTIAQGLQDGSLDPVETRRQVDAAGLSEFIRVVETRAELVAACAHFDEYGFVP